jgi:hypothetical protein
MNNKALSRVFLHVFLAVVSLTGARDVFAQQADSSPPSTIRRFVLAAGANDGGSSRIRLRYAHSDAQAVARVLRDLGGVSPQDSILLIDPGRAALDGAFEAMRQKLMAAKDAHTRAELLFYFSGHSDETALLLGGERYAYQEVRKAISGMPADVRIAVLDSCASGALTRGKGGVRKAPFIVDSSTDVRGFAILTSSSIDETAQESDRIGGSFFTHYLVSGLRGAADNSRDGRVTLNEAYQYAFNETLAGTESTQGGAQHPNYYFQLAGSGDLVLTDIRSTSSLLVLSPELEGHLYIRDAKGVLVVEINKPGGKSMSLGLEPGHYDVTWEREKKLGKTGISLAQGATTELKTAAFQPLKPEQTRTRGEQTQPVAVKEKAVVHPFSVGLFPGFTTDTGTREKVKNYVTLNFIGSGDYLSGVELSYLGAIRKNDVKGVQLAGVFNYADSHFQGAQGVGIVNISHDLVGVQGAGIVNVATGPVHGVQGAGIVNVARGPVLHEVQGTDTADTSEGLVGVQAAGIANVAYGPARGVQASGIVNFATDKVHGAQLAGIANVAREGDTDFQLSGITNASGSLSGAQISGIANLAMGEVHGLQLGLVNVGRKVSGAQIGLINIATDQMRGASIGLFNFAGDGIFAPTVWGGDTSFMNVGLKSGSRHFYSLVGAGVHPLGDKMGFSPLFGLGGHIELNPFWLEIDALCSPFLKHHDFKWHGHENTNDVITQLRLVFGYRLADQFAVYLGPTLNYFVSNYREDASLLPAFWHDTFEHGHFHQQLFMGFTLGVQYEPKWGALNARRAY